MKLHFLGAARQVTGSCYALENGAARIMIDCGLFQERAFQCRNWEPPPIAPNTFDAMLLTHAHLDHCGLIPRLVKAGFKGPIYTTPPSVELARIILEDAAVIQEEDAAFKQKRHEREGRCGPHTDEPLYTQRDVERVIPLLKPVPYGRVQSLGNGLSAVWHDAGHILGSAMIEVRAEREGRTTTIVFSGDLGQWDKPIIKDPTLLDQADYVVMESTYGDREHVEGGDVQDQLATAINETLEGGGNLLIPTFAVERAQELVYRLARLAAADRIPDVLVFLDSPMAAEVLGVFGRFKPYMDREAMEILASGRSLFDFPGFKLIASQRESKAINRLRGCVIMAGSGMCNAGRIKHHLAHNIADPRCTVCFTGYQAEGTLGRAILDGNDQVRILGRTHDVRAKVRQIFGLSAHADRTDLLRWIRHFRQPPHKVFLTHGEEKSARHLARELNARSGWNVDVPAYKEAAELD